MIIDDLFKLIEDIEEERKYIFVVCPETYKVGIDVLDYDDEEEIDGGWFDSVDEAYQFVNGYKGSL